MGSFRASGLFALLASGGCAGISGLNEYSSGTCGARCGDASVGGSSGGADASGDGVLGDDGYASSDTSVSGPDAASCDGASCSGTTSDSGTWTCSKGGCNQAAGACSSAEACYCTSDSQCISGKCVVASGRNDVSCGSSCSGSGPADGFQCALSTPGIPASCTVAAFAYTPANLTAAQLSALSPVAAVDLGCAGTVTYDGTAWSGATCGQTLPAAHTVTQTGGPTIDVLAFQELTLENGVTVNFTGTHAVMIVVFGDAAVSGSIHLDGAAGAPNTSTAGRSGPGGNASCGSSAGGTGSAGHTSGGGGGGAETAGGAGAGGVGGTGGAAGNAFGSTPASPLRGGCPGGASGDWACTTSGGGGGGALQISAAGTLTVAGAITASGGAGGTSNCASGGCAPGPNHTFGGGGGGGGAGGTIVLEAGTVTVSGSTTANGGVGGNPDSSLQEQGTGGAGSTSASQPGGNGTGYVNNGCGADDQSGGGGGGGYGHVASTSGKAANYSCSTTLAPTPACSSAHTACLCVSDSNCSSGKCVTGGAQCSGTCTGSGPPDVAGCASVSATPGG